MPKLFGAVSKVSQVLASFPQLLPRIGDLILYTLNGEAKKLKPLRTFAGTSGSRDALEPPAAEDQGTLRGPDQVIIRKDSFKGCISTLLVI